MADNIVLKVDVDTGDADKELKGLNKNLDKTGKSAKVVGKESKTGFSGMIKGVKGVGVALKTAGIGIFLAVISALFSLLKQNQSVMDFFNKATKTMAILFNNLTEKIKPLKDALMSAFEDPQQAIKDLWTVIKENMVNRVTGMVDFFKQSFSGLVNTIKGTGLAIKGIFSDEAKAESKEYFDAAKKDAKDAGESFLQMSTGIDDLPGKLGKMGKAAVDGFNAAASAADAFIEKENELKLATAEYNKTIAENRLELQNLKLVRDDESASMDDRIKSAAEITRIIEEESAGAIKLQQQKIDLMKADLDLTNTTIDDKIAISNAEAELSNIQAAAATRQRENLLKTNSLKKKLEKEKAPEEGPTPEEEDAEIKRMEEFRQRKKDLENEWKLEDAESEEEAIELEKEIEEERWLEQQELLAGKNEELEQAEKEHLREMGKLDEKAISEAQSRALAKSKFDEEIKNTKRKILDQGLADIMNIAGQESAIFKAALIAQNILAISDIIRNTQVAATAALTVPPLGLGPIAGIPLAALTIAGGAVSIASVVASTGKALGAFEKGGVLVGPSHAQGGILTQYGELEGGEGVINNMSMSNPSLRNLASAANTGGGGNDFSSGDGSISLSQSSISMIVNGINDKKVIVSETDITSTQNRVSVIESEAVL